MTQHTQGPWEPRKGYLGWHIHAPHASDVQLAWVAENSVYGKDGHKVSPDECEANARVMAASSHLLAALQELVGWQTTAPQRVLEDAHAAIELAMRHNA